MQPAQPPVETHRNPHHARQCPATARPVQLRPAPDRPQRGPQRKTALTDDLGSLRYGELAEQVQRMAAGLQSLGLRREDRVFLLMHDSCDWVVAFLGALYAGVVPVALNTLLTAEDYAFMLDHSRAQAALVSGALLPTLQAAMSQGPHELKALVVSRPAAALPEGAVDFAAPGQRPPATGKTRRHPG
jgi:benzoate-CoA ligase